MLRPKHLKWKPPPHPRWLEWILMDAQREGGKEEILIDRKRHSEGGKVCVCVYFREKRHIISELEEEERFLCPPSLVSVRISWYIP